MKINPVGVETYRQAMTRPAVDNRTVAENKPKVNETKINIPNETERTGSKLSVKLKPGTFTDMLSSEEKQALDMLFAKYNNIKQGDYSRSNETGETQLGNLVDIKL
jgi:hypothetical protein